MAAGRLLLRQHRCAGPQVLYLEFIKTTLFKERLYSRTLSETKIARAGKPGKYTNPTFGAGSPTWGFILFFLQKETGGTAKGE